MKTFITIFLSFLLAFPILEINAQSQQQKIDSLIVLFKKSRHDWNTYADQFIEIGEPAIPALVKMLEDKSLSQWQRRITAMTLNDIHSPLYIKSALKIFLDRNENLTLRNQVTNGLKGHDLSFAVSDLWHVYSEEADQWWFRSNIANLLLGCDTALAYIAFHEIYNANDGHLKQGALSRMVQLRPHESTYWYVQGLQTGDWMTANLAMDSLVTTEYLIPMELLGLYNQPATPEEVKWRVVYIFGHRELPESLPLLVEALKNPSWLIYNEAAVGLSRMEGEEVMQEIKQLTKSDDPRVVKDAKWVKKQLMVNR